MRTSHISTLARVPRSASSVSLLTCLMTGVVYTPPVLRRISIIRNIANMEERGHQRGFAVGVRSVLRQENESIFEFTL